MSSRFLCRIRSGCKPNLPGLGLRRLLLLKLTLMGTPQNRTYRGLGERYGYAIQDLRKNNNFSIFNPLNPPYQGTLRENA